jgi:O-antigen ligase
LLLILLVLPFFGGAESPFGLFLVHLLVLLLSGVLICRYRRLWIPRFLIYFSPLLLAYFLSTVFAPYRYGAALEFWDVCVVGIFAVVALSTLRESESIVPPFVRTAFFFISAMLLLSLFLSNPFHGNRLTGTFVNPNDFGAFSLLVALAGFSQYEREGTSFRKTVLLILTIAAGLCAALSLSRSVFLASAIVFAYYLWRRRPGRVLSMSVLALLILGGSFLAYRVFYHPDVFQYYRLRIWANTLRAVKEDPYLGIGPNMLPYYASRITFPADIEVGRFARLATSADNQYLQCLAETGFVGLFCFLIGWIALYLTVRNHEPRNPFSLLAYLAVSVIAFFGLPFLNTSILFLFFFLTIVPLSADTEQQIVFSLRPVLKWLLCVLLLGLFMIAVLIPYLADLEFKSATRAKNAEEYRRHQMIATRLNPYQPYYTFHFMERLINSRPDLDVSTWRSVLPKLDHLIALNPLEPDFYVGKARVLRILYDKTGQAAYAIDVAAAYQEALHCVPTNVFLQGEFADFEKHLGHYSLAIATMQKVIELEPAFINARYVLADLRFRTSDVAGARRDFEEGKALEKRYSNYPLNGDDRYSRRLLSVNTSYRQKVEDLVFDHAKD